MTVELFRFSVSSKVNFDWVILGKGLLGIYTYKLEILDETYKAVCHFLLLSV